MNIYPIVKNPTLICGYNSLGGGCVINHLHFEFFMLDDFGNEITCLPIENKKANLLFETKLKYKNEKEISMFDGTTLLKIYEINEPFNCWKIETIISQEQKNEIDNLYQNSLAHLANLILSKLVDKAIPHNLIFTNQGNNLYLIPRKFENLKSVINTCWNDLAGLITCKEQKTFNEITLDEIEKIFKDEVSLENNTFKELTDTIISQVDSVYEIKKY